MSSTITTRAPFHLEAPQANTPCSRSTQIAGTPRCREVSGRDQPSHRRSDDIIDLTWNFRAIFPASALQSFSVLSACMKTRAFCRKTGLRRPEVRIKMPLQNGAGFAKDIKHLGGIHAISIQVRGA
jgi:hypothetical protein